MPNAINKQIEAKENKITFIYTHVTYGNNLLAKR